MSHACLMCEGKTGKERNLAILEHILLTNQVNEDISARPPPFT